MIDAFSQQGNVLAVHARSTGIQSRHIKVLEEAVMERQPSSVRDPVCGMAINPQHAAATTTYQGQTFYFCRVECQEEFHQNPERYAKAA